MLEALRETSALDLQIVGRTILHAAVVGLAAGLVGALFYATLELLESVLLEQFAGYVPLHAAHGSVFEHGSPSAFRPLVLLVLPALGGLICGLVTRFAPEARGGGGDAMIDAFHQEDGRIRPRVVWVKFIASIATLGTGGSGGREGPTMQIGAAIGSLAARLLRVTKREQRVLMVAGVAAGMAAVFRTPLGAALLAVEVMYRDDFESEALIPALLASVVAYSVVISIFGESTLFGVSHRFPFEPGHLVWFGLLGVVIAAAANTFVIALNRVHALSRRIALPGWAKPALGGLALALLYWPCLRMWGTWEGHPVAGLDILGSGYGAVQQMALTPADWMPVGWAAVRLIVVLGLAKLLATALTIGSGGSAGDFAPSFVLGGLFGGAFGLIVRLLLHDPSIDPAAFALVGMGAFYGGIAHVPLAAAVMVCELAGSYDLLVPLMLAEGIAFIALRNRFLYHSQPTNKRASPAHREEMLLEALEGAGVGALLSTGDHRFVPLDADIEIADMLRRASGAPLQEVFPVLDHEQRLVGMITPEVLRDVATYKNDGGGKSRARDVMKPPAWVRTTDDLRAAMKAMLENHIREIPVLDERGKVVGLLDEAEISQAWLSAATRTG